MIYDIKNTGLRRLATILGVVIAVPLYVLLAPFDFLFSLIRGGLADAGDAVAEFGETMRALPLAIAICWAAR